MRAIRRALRISRGMGSSLEIMFRNRRSGDEPHAQVTPSENRRSEKEIENAHIWCTPATAVHSIYHNAVGPGATHK
jgi:hypothetical protein